MSEMQLLRMILVTTVTETNCVFGTALSTAMISD